MSGNLPKRFWNSASVHQVNDGFSIVLDDKPLKTPAKKLFVVPSRGLAKAITEEWDALEERIDPTRLPLTKLSNAAIDNMAEKAGAVVDALTEYGATDLLCYRADSPIGLVARQSDAWDPLLDWVRDTHGIFLFQTTGVMPVVQPDSSISKFRVWLEEMDKFQLMCCHDLVILSGSIVIARAVVEAHLSPQSGWETSIVDDMWQAQTWGEDDEAAELRAVKAHDFSTAARMMSMVTD